MTSLPGPPLKFNETDSQWAAKTWKASCGPHSIAAACELSLEQVRPALLGYRGWMNPTQMEAALRALGKPVTVTKGLKTQELCEGISRIQWEGSWLNPGVPPRVAYHHTHWVAHRRGWVLCTACLPHLWIPIKHWRHFHLNVSPPTPFHVTHHFALTSG